MLSYYAKYLIYFISGSILIIAVTTIAEKKSPKIAGIVMTLPVITFLSLLFMGVSQGVEFSSKAAVWSPIGAIADLVYVGLFAVGIRVPEYIEKNIVVNENINKIENNRMGKIKEILFGLLFGFIGYFIFILIFSQFSITNGWISLVSLWIAAIISFTIFKIMKDTKVEKLKRLSLKEILFRGLFGGSVVALVVILGDSIGYIWGGLFSSFPGTITPVLIILHLKYGTNMSHNVIKSAPIGLSATGLYSFMVWLFYPDYGIIVGTFVSFLTVLGFLFVIKNLKKF